MNYSDAEQLRKKWGDKPCLHPQIEAEMEAGGPPLSTMSAPPAARLAKAVGGTSRARRRIHTKRSRRGPTGRRSIPSLRAHRRATGHRNVSCLPIPAELQATGVQTNSVDCDGARRIVESNSEGPLPTRAEAPRRPLVRVGVNDTLGRHVRLELLVAILAGFDQLAVGRDERLEVLTLGGIARCNAGVRHPLRVGVPRRRLHPARIARPRASRGDRPGPRRQSERRAPTRSANLRRSLGLHLPARRPTGCAPRDRRARPSLH